MAGLGDTLEIDFLRNIFKRTAVATSVTDIFVSLHSTDPGDTGAGELPLSNGYQRSGLTGGAAIPADTNASTHTNWTDVVGGSGNSKKVSNAQPVVFPAATGDWFSGAPIKWFGLWTQLTGGIFLLGGQLNGTTGVVVLNGNVLSFPSPNLSIEID